MWGFLLHIFVYWTIFKLENLGYLAPSMTKDSQRDTAIVENKFVARERGTEEELTFE